MSQRKRRGKRAFLGCAASAAVAVGLWPGLGLADAERSKAMTVVQAREASLSGNLILVDIRTSFEWRESGIPDVATALDMTQPGFAYKLLALRRGRSDAQIGLICATGGRSRRLAQWLRRNSVTGVVDVPAGLHTANGWLANKLPVKVYRPSLAERLKER